MAIEDMGVLDDFGAKRGVIRRASQFLHVVLLSGNMVAIN